jgi:hypothetical protein
VRKYQVEITKIAGSDIQEIFKYILRDNIKWVKKELFYGKEQEGRKRSFNKTAKN